jgi:hypothetical protein
MAPGDSAKRKRGVGDAGAGRPSPSIRSNVASSVAAAAATAAAAAQEVSLPMDSYDESAISQLIAHNNGELQNGGQPGATPETAQAALTHYQVPPSFETGAAGGPGGDPNGPFSMEAGFVDQLKEASAQAASSITPQQGTPQTPASNPKPPVGSEEWHRIRRDNHKEGEKDPGRYSKHSKLTDH